MQERAVDFAERKKVSLGSGYWSIEAKLVRINDFLQKKGYKPVSGYIAGLNSKSYNCYIHPDIYKELRAYLKSIGL